MASSDALSNSQAAAELLKACAHPTRLMSTQLSNATPRTSCAKKPGPHGVAAGAAHRRSSVRSAAATSAATPLLPRGYLLPSLRRTRTPPRTIGSPGADVDPDCADAYVILAEQAGSLEDELDHH